MLYVLGLGADEYTIYLYHQKNKATWGAGRDRLTLKQSLLTDLVSCISVMITST